MGLFDGGKKDRPAKPRREELATSISLTAMPLMLAEVGKIKIGGRGEPQQSRNGGTYYRPERYDHFVVTMLERASDGRGNFIPNEEIMAQIGPDCKALPVRLLYNDPIVSFPHWFSWYQGNRCICRGNGEQAHRTEKDRTQVIQCNPTVCPQAQEDVCKATGILSVVLPDSPIIGGVYKFRTCSVISVCNLRASLSWLQALTGGHLAGLPLVLRLYQKSMLVNKPGKTPFATTVGVVNLEYYGEPAELRELVARVMEEQTPFMPALRAAETAARREMVRPEAAKEIQEVTDEFFPGQNPDYHEEMQAPPTEAPTAQPATAQEPENGAGVLPWMDRSLSKVRRWNQLNQYALTQLRIPGEKMRQILGRMMGGKLVNDWTDEDFLALQAELEKVASC